MMEVYFFVEELDFKIYPEQNYKEWIMKIAEVHSAEINIINYIFCSNDYLLKINLEYLQHDYYTDIISFPYSEYPNPLEGDIFISVDMVKENASRLEVNFEQELHRVMAHGILHFLGYKDKSKEDVQKMRAKEEEMMELF